MKLSVRNFALSAGMLWAAAVLLLALANLAVPTYGTAFLAALGSVYPGFYASHTLLGGFYGFIDGGLAGGIFAALYNAFAKRAGIEKAVSPHFLRHAHASHAIERGVKVTTIRDTLGHASIAITDRYAHARPEESSGLALTV